MKRLSESVRKGAKKSARKQAPTTPNITDSSTSVEATASELAKARLERRSDANSPIIPFGGGLGSREISNVKLLHYICDVLTWNAAALRKEIIEGEAGNDKAIDLAEALIVAGQIAKRVAWNGRSGDLEATMQEMTESPDCIRLIELPGIASRAQSFRVMDILTQIIYSIAPFFEVISRKILDRVPDLERAFELAEAMAIAEQVMDRDGTLTDIEKEDGKPTWLQRQARDFKYRLLLKLS